MVVRGDAEDVQLAAQHIRNMVVRLAHLSLPTSATLAIHDCKLTLFWCVVLNGPGCCRAHINEASSAAAPSGSFRRQTVVVTDTIRLTDDVAF